MGDIIQTREDLLKRVESISRQLSQQSHHNVHQQSSFQTPQMIQNCVLKKYQEIGAQWLMSLYKNHINGILGDDMGLGKTLQAITFLALLKENCNNNGPFLIICPLTLVNNWIREFSKFCPSMKSVRYIGKKEEREEIQNSIFDYLQQFKEDQLDDPPLDFQVLVTSYDMILMDCDFLSSFKWRVIIVDEGHRLKNHQSALYTTLVEQYNHKTASKFLLTGTPVHNNLAELWSLMHFIMPDLFTDCEDFQQWFLPNSSNTGTDLSDLHSAIRPFILRRRKAEVLSDLPNKTESILYTKLSKMQKRYYRAILTKDRDALGKSNRRALVNIVINLRKCCNHPYLFDGAEPEPYVEGEHLVENSGKLILLDKLLKKLKYEGHKVLIFSQMTNMLDIVQDYMHLRKFTYERLDGSVRGEERFSAINRFSDKETFAFLLSTRAGGMGLNLIQADTVIFIDSDWNPQMDLQAQERVHRIGQTKEVHVYRIITEDTIEEIMLKRALKKLELSMNVIEKGGFSSSNTSTEISSSSNDISSKSDDTNDMISLIKFGLHKVITSDNLNDEMEERELLNLDIESVLEKGKTVSFTEVVTQSLENIPNDDFYTYEGISYKKSKVSSSKGEKSNLSRMKKQKSTIKKKKKSVHDEHSSDDDYSMDNEKDSDFEEDEDIEDEDTFKKLITSNQDDEDEDDYIDSSRYRLRKRKNDFDRDIDDDESQGKKRRTKTRDPNYKSLAIVIDNLALLGQKSEALQDEDAANEDAANEDASFDFDKLNDETTRGDIHYVIGDVTHPSEGVANLPKFIINCVSDLGKWGNGGLFSSIDKISSLPKKNYEDAKKNDDLRTGDAHLIPISSSSNGNQIYVVNTVAQHFDSKSRTHSGILLQKLETALHKVAFAARKLGASIHCPRIGYGSSNFNWYGVERVIKKCLVRNGVETFVYYFKRGTQIPSGNVSLSGSQSSSHTLTLSPITPTTTPTTTNTINATAIINAGGSSELLDCGRKDHSQGNMTQVSNQNKVLSKLVRIGDDQEKTVAVTTPSAIPEHKEKQYICDQDVFEGIAICLYKVKDLVNDIPEGMSWKSMILLHGGVIFSNLDDLPDQNSVIVSDIKFLDETLTSYKRSHKDCMIVTTNWVMDCIKRNTHIQKIGGLFSTYEIVEFKIESDDDSSTEDEEEDNLQFTVLADMKNPHGQDQEAKKQQYSSEENQNGENNSEEAGDATPDLSMTF